MYFLLIAYYLLHINRKKISAEIQKNFPSKSTRDSAIVSFMVAGANGAPPVSNFGWSVPAFFFWQVPEVQTAFQHLFSFTLNSAGLLRTVNQTQKRRGYRVDDFGNLRIFNGDFVSRVCLCFHRFDFRHRRAR